MPKQKQPELSMTASIILCLVGLSALLGMVVYKKSTSKPRAINKELQSAIAELKAKQSDPRVKACSDAAWAMGKTFREQGKQKPSDSELHSIAIAACDHFKVPAQMRGVAVEKFKSGFGWGWSQGL